MPAQAQLSLEPEFTRGHGALYDALSAGRTGGEQLFSLLAAELPQAVDATAYPRPDAWCSPGREHVHNGACRCEGSSKTAPGWEYQFTAAIGHLRTAWAALVDVARTTPATRTAETLTLPGTPLYGTVRAGAWHRVHPLIHGDRGWFAGRKKLPVLRGTLARVTAGRLPGGADMPRTANTALTRQKVKT